MQMGWPPIRITFKRVQSNFNSENLCLEISEGEYNLCMIFHTELVILPNLSDASCMVDYDRINFMVIVRAHL